MIKIKETEIQSVKLIETTSFIDERGSFKQNYHQEQYSQIGMDSFFVQDNFSQSQKGVLRGMHYQLDNPQAKLIYVLSGSIFDVAVDMRSNSSTFGKWIGKTLSSKNGLQLYIPRGFAHGFLTLESNTIVSYKCDNFYNCEDEYGVKWNDLDLNIAWPTKDNLIVSEKDQLLPSFREAKYFKN